MQFDLTVMHPSNKNPFFFSVCRSLRAERNQIQKRYSSKMIDWHEGAVIFWTRLKKINKLCSIKWHWNLQDSKVPAMLLSKYSYVDLS